jgi:hypothetical protein
LKSCRSNERFALDVIQNTDRQETADYLQNQQMKRRIQFAAILLTGLLAVQPALAALPCVQGTPATCVPGCPMMSSMGADCHMSGMTAAGNCPQNCCSQSLPQAFAFVATPIELHLSAIASPVALPFALPAAELRFTVRSPIDARAASPPPYLLNHVFRI